MPLQQKGATLMSWWVVAYQRQHRSTWTLLSTFTYPFGKIRFLGKFGQMKCHSHSHLNVGLEQLQSSCSFQHLFLTPYLTLFSFFLKLSESSLKPPFHHKCEFDN